MSSAYHSNFNATDCKTAYGMAILPLRTSISGPAPKTQDKDVIDETLFSFRANIFFKNYDIKGII
jgi:actin related protein 2/3 complex subunit 3